MAGRGWHLTRTALTAVNGTTGFGLLLAAVTGARIRRGRHGVLIAENYRFRRPGATCFTVGSVIITKRTAEWLLAEERERLFTHECRHAGQYAFLGPLFWPAYWVACGWSIALTRSYGVRNWFEKNAGLADGRYPEELPLRPWVRRLRRQDDARPSGEGSGSGKGRGSGEGHGREKFGREDGRTAPPGT